MRKVMPVMLIAALILSVSTSNFVNTEAVQLILQIAALAFAAIGGYFAKSADEVKRLMRKRGED